MADAWVAKANLPSARFELAGAAIGTKLYVSGGQNAAGTFLADLLEWDQATDTWTAKASMPAVRSQHKMVAIGTKLYAMGGIAASAAEPDPLTTLWEWDQGTDTWTTKAPMPFGRRRFGACAVGTSIYVHAGVGKGEPIAGGGAAGTRTFWVWDQAADTWTQLRTNSSPVADPFANGAGGSQSFSSRSAMAELGGKPVIVAGRVTATTTTTTSQVWEYDPVADTFTALTAGTTSYDHVANLRSGSIYQTGGISNSGVNLDTHRQLATGPPILRTPLPLTIASAAGGVIGTKIYLAGGFSGGAGSLVDDLYEWDDVAVVTTGISLGMIRLN